MLRQTRQILEDLVALVYPNLCLSCETQLIAGEQTLCILCQNDLPETDHHLDPENPVFKHFWGRVNISFAASFYYFSKGSRVQHMMHQFKYKGKKEVGIKLGELYGQRLRKASNFKGLDYIIPVPLHPKKEHFRGFNQSDLFALGLSRSLGLPVKKKWLARKSYTESQTKKSREERWGNVSRVFETLQPEKLKNKHLLVVDDVITTGATMEACAQKLLLVPGVKVSVASIACADHW